MNLGFQIETFPDWEYLVISDLWKKKCADLRIKTGSLIYILKIFFFFIFFVFILRSPRPTQKKNNGTLRIMYHHHQLLHFLRQRAGQNHNLTRHSPPLSPQVNITPPTHPLLSLLSKSKRLHQPSLLFKTFSQSTSTATTTLDVVPTLQPHHAAKSRGSSRRAALLASQWQRSVCSFYWRGWIRMRQDGTLGGLHKGEQTTFNLWCRT